MNDNLRPPSPLNVAAMSSVCTDTISGWLWYCDEHDTHGNADSRLEAETMADAHSDFFDEDGGERCEVIVWQRTPHERT
ncbi:MAG TPA: hypothetical protein VF049_15610 [Nocardioidaceae bacterium]